MAINGPTVAIAIKTDCPQCDHEVTAWLPGDTTLHELRGEGNVLTAYHREEHESCPLEGLIFVRVKVAPGSLAIKTEFYRGVEL